LAQLVDSGPDRPDDTIFTLLVSACFTSRQRILAVTPYFVPGSALLNALMLAARRGIEVDLVIPARSNHKLADFARHRALRDLTATGARIWMHPRMVHAKAVLVDDELALVGSANLDGRSLFLNYEMMIAFYDQPAVTEFARWFVSRREECAPYVSRSPGLAREIAEGLLLWLAFQL
jgi:cardiolipin synthase